MKVFCFDVETDGLYGAPFAVGAVVLSESGEEIERFAGIAQIKIKNDWVKQNVLPNLEGLQKYETDVDLREAFWDIYQKHKGDSYILVDVGYPVETNFLRQVILDDLENRQWNGPYPLYDVSSVLQAKGIDPDVNRIEYSGLKGLKPHNPADDALASAMTFIKVMANR
ncbi:hypothetical protein L1765_11275 [Microaerobacter geothermalis]|uniref:hypothetical protein n=1 Tax=Microaerobacter geothermalis TaxID=674972 RepID=UPI001F1C4770|nr:hypothetical protein [Microaerobacter geothermalis]MCF6094544.1 hypothetical protein [Microaerobacter geothermalis]